MYPGTTEIADYILRRWPTTRNSGVYGCRRNTNNGAYLSVHAVGRAIDIGVPLAGGDADNTVGDEIGNWLMANAEHIGVQRVGWDGMWFNGERGFGSRMCSRQCGDADFPAGCWPCNPHVDHLHIEVSVDAANRRTRFFTEGPPGERCPVVCYGNAAVAEDCSYVDCAAQGQVCMDGPVRCADAAPPEPPTASHHPGATLPRLTPIGAPARFRFMDPTRVFDTRPEGDDDRLIRPGSGPLNADDIAVVRDFPGVMAGARGVWLNLAAVLGAAPGHVRVAPAGADPQTSSLNYLADTIRSNAAPVALGAQGGVGFKVVGGDVHLVADIFAAFGDAGDGLRSVAPRRVADSRDTPEPVPAMTPFVVDVDAPAGATGVVASVAVINDERGFVRVYACDDPVPETSAINYEGLGVVAGTVVSRLSAQGELCLWSLAPVELIVDVTGYFVPEGELSYQPVAPVRLLDTREDDALYRGRVGDGQTFELPIQSLAGAPADIQSVVVNLTAAQSDEVGHLTAFPCGFEAPLTSALNFGAARGPVGSVAQSSIADGKLCLRARNRTHLIVDLLGVWVPTPGAEATPSAPPEDNNPQLPAEPDGALNDAGPPDAATESPDAAVAPDQRVGEDPADSGSPGADARVDAGAGQNGGGCSATGHPMALWLLFLGLTRRRA